MGLSDEREASSLSAEIDKIKCIRENYQQMTQYLKRDNTLKPF